MPDNNNWIEGTKFKIKIAHTSGQLQSPTGKIHFTMGDGHLTDLADIDVQIPRMGDIEQEVTLPVVKDDAFNYRFSYKINADNKDIVESDWFYVWPSKIDLTVKYKKGDGDTSKLTDGATVPDFPFSVGETDENKKAFDGGPFKTDPTGNRVFSVTSKAEVTIKPKSPWELMEPTDQSGSKRKREIKVRMKPWKAVLKSHNGGKTESAPIKQIVNAPQDYAKAQGSLVKVEVGPGDLADGLKDQEIKVRVTFPATNCKRLDPFPALWLKDDKTSAQKPNPDTSKPGEAELKYEAVVKLPADGQAAVFYIQLGVCGGDKCKVEVGVTDAYSDDIVYLVNWRQIGLELLIADPTIRQKCSSVLADTGAALGDDLKNELNRIFDGTFIEFIYPTTGCAVLLATDIKKYLKGDGSNFTTENIGKPDELFVARSKFAIHDYDTGTSSWKKITLSDGGDKVFLCSSYQSRFIRESKLSTVVKSKNTMTWLFVDFVSARSSVQVLGTPPSWTADMSKIKNFYMTSFETAADKEVELPFQVFEKDPIQANGAAGIIDCLWKATDYRKKGAPAWTTIGSPTDPGGAHMNWHHVPFSSTAEQNKWCEIIDSVTVKMKLKKDGPTDPGNLMSLKRQEAKVPPPGTEEVEYELKVLVQVNFFGVEFNILGGAACGEGSLRTGGGRVTGFGLAQTMAHEIAHNCGQTYAAKMVPEVGGWSNSAIPGIPFPSLFPASSYYVGKGHCGSHCAKALLKIIDSASQDEKNAVAAGSFTAPSPTHNTSYFSKVKQTDQCIMYGSKPEITSDAMDLCDSCKGYLKAADLSDVCKAW
jgi:hypothetical protein